MFSFAFLIGIYSFAILALGISSQLYKTNILAVTILFLFSVTIVFVKSFKKTEFKSEINRILSSKISIIVLVLLLLQLVVNLVGVFGLEISFDALWYHLTLPKIFLINHQIVHIPGSLLYYSDLPKLGETLYVAALSVSNEILAKFIHFLFGIFSSYAIYRIARKYLNSEYSLLAVIIFYSSLVVGWLSIAAYVDLIRTFFEIISFWAFIEWIDTKKTSWLIESALFVGLSICVKLTGFVSLFVYLPFLVYVLRNKKIKEILGKSILFVFLAIIVPLPYFLLSLLNTGNPVYPLFSGLLSTNIQFNPYFYFKEAMVLLASSPDPISPIYLIFIPLVVVYFKKIGFVAKIIFIFSLISFVLIIILPIGDKGRFFLPYLPILSIGIAVIFSKLNNTLIKKTALVVILFLSFISIGYRAEANSKFLPYLTGRESKQQFLTKNLNFSFGDFYDTDNFFEKQITNNDKVLLFGFHNLYYVNFPFIDSSWVKSGDSFNYILTQNSGLPDRFKFWHIIYSNPVTKVNLYTLGGIKWVY